MRGCAVLPPPLTGVRVPFLRDAQGRDEGIPAPLNQLVSSRSLPPGRQLLQLLLVVLLHFIGRGHSSATQRPPGHSNDVLDELLQRGALRLVRTVFRDD